MADSDEINPYLFLEESGRAVHFYMPPCPERAKLRPIIEAGGGTISVQILPGCIKLAATSQKVHSKDLVKTKYVTDCVQSGKLLDVEEYRLAVGVDTASDEDGAVSDISMDGPTIKCSKRKVMGRTKFLLAEDMRIIHYILDEQLYREISGNLMWQNMALLKLVNHPWQATRDRFLKQILPNIKSYQLTQWETSLLITSCVTSDAAGLPELTSPRSSPRKRPRTVSPSSPRKHAAERPKSPVESMLPPPCDVEFDSFDRALLACMDDATVLKPSPSPPTVINSESQPQLQPQPQLHLQSQLQLLSQSQSQTLPATITAEVSSSTSPEQEEVSRAPPTTANSRSPVKPRERFPMPPLLKRRRTKSLDLQLELPAVRESVALRVPLNKDRSGDESQSDSGRKEKQSSESQEESPSVIASPKAKQCATKKIDEPVARNVSNNASTDQAAEDDVPVVSASKKADPNGVRALKQFVLDSQLSEPQIQNLVASPSSSENMARNQRYLKAVCRWLGLQPEELLYVLWRTSGSMNEAITWILDGGSHTVPVWRPCDDQILKVGDEKELCELETRFGSDRISKRLVFLALNS